MLPQSRLPESGSDLADTELMSRVMADDRHAFKELYDRHGGRVHAYLYRMVHDEALAEDLRQEVFIRLWQVRAAWCEKGTVAGYLIRVSHTLALNACQARRVRHHWVERVANGPQRVAPSPNDVMAQDAIMARVDQAIEALPERSRRAFILKRDASLSYKEIGELLGISPNTVGIHLSRAYKLLREALQDIRS